MMRRRLRAMTSVTGGTAGFTLIELVAVMATSGVLAAIGVFSFQNWRLTAEQQGSAQGLVSQLRGTAEQALSEGRTHCVDLDPATKTYSVWRYSCSSAGTKVTGTLKTQSTRVGFTPSLVPPTPTPPCPTGHSCLYFYPRGTAIPATIDVTSTKRTKVYTIHVEGLTARVFM
jgi:prepilin-type N-terminal cleavage/methylation domain-containing protein